MQEKARLQALMSLALKVLKTRSVVFLTHLLVPRIFLASRPLEKQLIFKGLKLSQGDRHDGMEVAVYSNKNIG